MLLDQFLELNKFGGVPYNLSVTAIISTTAFCGPAFARTKLYCLVTEAHGCEQLAQGCYSSAWRPTCDDCVTSLKPYHWTIETPKNTLNATKLPKFQSIYMKMIDNNHGRECMAKSTACSLSCMIFNPLTDDHIGVNG